MLCKESFWYLCFELLELVVLGFLVCVDLLLGFVSRFLYSLCAVCIDQLLLS